MRKNYCADLLLSTSRKKICFEEGKDLTPVNSEKFQSAG